MQKVFLEEDFSGRKYLMDILQPLLPTLEQFADLWDKKIFVRRMISNNIANTDPSILNIYLFFNDPPGAFVFTKKVESLFGYPLLNNSLLTRSNLELPRFFYSPEGNPVAEIRDGDIKILIDFTNIPPETAQDLLEIILTFCIPQALPREKAQKRPMMLQKLKRQPGEKFLKKLISYLISTVKKSIQELKSTIAKEETEILKIDKLRITNLRKISELEDGLKTFSAMIMNNHTRYEELFDQLMRMEDVRAIAVENGNLIIYTKKIVKKMEDIEKEYDLGAYKITFDPRMKSHFGITFDLYELGTHQSQYIVPGQQVCFGNQPDYGLNVALDKLMMEFEVAPLIDMTLSFLKFEDQPPYQTPWHSNEIKRVFLNSCPLIDFPKAKKEFADFMKKTKLSFLAEPTHKSLKSHQVLEDQLRLNYSNIRARIQSNRILLENLESQLNKDAKTDIVRGMQEIHSNPLVKKIVFKNGLRIWLWNESLSWPMLVWLADDRLPWVIHIEGDYLKATPSHRLILSNNETNKMLLLIARKELIPAALRTIEHLFSSTNFWGQWLE